MLKSSYWFISYFLVQRVIQVWALANYSSDNDGDDDEDDDDNDDVWIFLSMRYILYG